jgi:hypothetical protein
LHLPVGRQIDDREKDNQGTRGEEDSPGGREQLPQPTSNSLGGITLTFGDSSHRLRNQTCFFPILPVYRQK